MENWEGAPHPTNCKGLFINHGVGGGSYKMGKSQFRNFVRSPLPPEDRVKLFAPPPLFGGWKLFATPFSMAKTFCTPPPLLVGVKLHLPPLPFCTPPPAS